MKGSLITTRLDVLPDGFSSKELEDHYYNLTCTDNGSEAILSSPSLYVLDSVFNDGVAMILDSVEAKYKMLPALMKRVSRVLSRGLVKASGGVLNADTPEIADPKKSGGFATVTVKFPISDGQSISAIFHAPDDDPLRVNPDDNLIAFRWLLNSRDITHVVTPESSGGVMRDISLDTVVKRLSQIANKNTVKFTANRKRAEEQRQSIADLKEEVDGYAAQITEQNEELEKTQSEIKSSHDIQPVLSNKLKKLIEGNEELQAIIDEWKEKPKEQGVEGGKDENKIDLGSIPEAGSLYDKNENLTTKEIAKKIRTTLRQSIKNGGLPRGVDFSLRTDVYAGGSAINIEIKKIPDSMLMYSKEFSKRRADEGMSATSNGIEMYSPEFKSLLEFFKGHGEAYNYDNSDSSTDYYDVNFSLSVNPDHELSSLRGKEEMEAASKNKEDDGSEDLGGLTGSEKQIKLALSIKEKVSPILSKMLSVDLNTDKDADGVVIRRRGGNKNYWEKSDVDDVRKYIKLALNSNVASDWIDGFYGALKSINGTSIVDVSSAISGGVMDIAGLYDEFFRGRRDQVSKTITDMYEKSIIGNDVSSQDDIKNKVSTQNDLMSNIYTKALSLGFSDEYGFGKETKGASLVNIAIRHGKLSSIKDEYKAIDRALKNGETLDSLFSQAVESIEAAYKKENKIERQFKTVEDYREEEKKTNLGDFWLSPDQDWPISAYEYPEIPVPISGDKISALIDALQEKSESEYLDSLSDVVEKLESENRLAEFNDRLVEIDKKRNDEFKSYVLSRLKEQDSQ